MFANQGRINRSALSLDSLSMERDTGEADPDLPDSRMATPLVAKRYFQFYHQAKADIQGSPLSLKLWLLCALFVAAVEIVIARLNTSVVNYCTTAGSFLFLVERDYWVLSDFFQVNIAAGNLTFTQAKVIDTTWDLIVGRGGQATLSLITWRVFADYAAMSMTIQPITFATYRILFVDNEPSISSATRLFRDFIKFKRLASKLASVFLIYSTLLSLALPTLVGSATGYAPLNEGFIRAYDNNLVPISNFNQQSSSIGSLWEHSNETYPEDDIQKRGICIPVKDCPQQRINN
ncbi:hypothetical protein O1611_g880 [Lasiodiplodia mahajangana]|uniref:Uncharacterized protein n=1 Tax=Lasiodiplodia mahajangana TaxID=1108764 RepID=A0ACC2JZL7_9PEZI|nr:hypothetical protein O1611_g880 [Lasiodiplodia mahajangana]